MKKYNFEDFQEAWDAQREVFEKMQLIRDDEVQKMMMEHDSSLQKKENGNEYKKRTTPQPIATI